MNDVKEPQPVPEASGSCFKDQGRTCGADCMAYLTEAPAGKMYLGQQWARCLILVNEERSARHLTIIANELTAKHAEARRNAPAPAVPR